MIRFLFFIEQSLVLGNNMLFKLWNFNDLKNFVKRMFSRDLQDFSHRIMLRQLTEEVKQCVRSSVTMKAVLIIRSSNI